MSEGEVEHFTDIAEIPSILCGVGEGRDDRSLALWTVHFLVFQCLTLSLSEVAMDFASTPDFLDGEVELVIL